MSQRGMTAAALTELGAITNQPCHLVEVTTETSGTPSVVYMTDYSRNLDWDGNTYLAVGNLLGVGNISESAEFQIQKLDLALSGVDQSLVSLFINNNYLDQPVSVYMAFINNGAVVISPSLLFKGNMDSITMSEDPDSGQSTLRASASSLFVDFQRKSGRHTTDSDQQHYFPGDLFFRPAVNQVASKQWGK
ncbi:hypothetical protein HN588_06675 [Candidatus Bathyarchaeota archaeon]|jgi:hypothetical protein|nr:hypothetical protein [Candidatus Bathyarchaeota archaeon]